MNSIHGPSQVWNMRSLQFYKYWQCWNQSFPIENDDDNENPIHPPSWQCSMLQRKEFLSELLQLSISIILITMIMPITIFTGTMVCMRDGLASLSFPPACILITSLLCHIDKIRNSSLVWLLSLSFCPFSQNFRVCSTRPMKCLLPHSVKFPPALISKVYSCLLLSTSALAPANAWEHVVWELARIWHCCDLIHSFWRAVIFLTEL